MGIARVCWGGGGTLGLTGGLRPIMYCVWVTVCCIFCLLVDTQSKSIAAFLWTLDGGSFKRMFSIIYICWNTRASVFKQAAFPSRLNNM